MPGRGRSRIQSWEALKLFSGGGALVAGLFLLRTVPVTAVLIVLGAMGWVLISAAALCGEREPCSRCGITGQADEDTSTKGAT